MVFQKTSLLHFECRNFDYWKNKWGDYIPAKIIGYPNGTNVFLKEFIVAYKNQDIKGMQKYIQKKIFYFKEKKNDFNVFWITKKN